MDFVHLQSLTPEWDPTSLYPCLVKAFLRIGVIISLASLPPAVASSSLRWVLAFFILPIMFPISSKSTRPPSPSSSSSTSDSSSLEVSYCISSCDGPSPLQAHAPEPHPSLVDGAALSFLSSSCFQKASDQALKSPSCPPCL